MSIDRNNTEPSATAPTGDDPMIIATSLCLPNSILQSLCAPRRATNCIQDDADEVYDEVTEEEYQQLVRKRQQADDFVVDDDGLGYADDGEEFIERLDAVEGDRGKGGAGKGINGKINSETLRRKARKLNQ